MELEELQILLQDRSDVLWVIKIRLEGREDKLKSLMQRSEADLNRILSKYENVSTKVLHDGLYQMTQLINDGLEEIGINQLKQLL
jgi:hypothetical protein